MTADSVFKGIPISMEQVLESRSAIAERQRHLLKKSDKCLISFGLNIPGKIKQFSLARCSFDEGLKILKKRFGNKIILEEIIELPLGNKAFLLIDEEPLSVKKVCVRIEKTHPLGRLFDIDIIGKDGEPLSRKSIGELPRKCLICSQDAKICGRNQTHSINELRSEIARRMSEFFCQRGAEICQKAALRAMLYEVSVTPKPGLVDRRNTGSHQDMDFFSFVDSSIALSPWVNKFYRIGWESYDKSTEELFLNLRCAGKQAEETMFAATLGVNTHKGLIFSLAVICGAMGRKHYFIEDEVDMNEVLEECSVLGRFALQDFEKQGEETYGRQCYERYHTLGIRGEAAEGFSSVTDIGVRCLKREIDAGRTINDAAVITLLTLISRVDDTNMIHRGGYDQSVRCKKEAQLLITESNGSDGVDRMFSLDDEYIAKGLSPGGCADLLALSFFLYFVEQEQKRR